MQLFDLDRWTEIIHVLKSNKLRTFLTAFGVFWGIFMLIIMLGAGSGLENGANDNMGDFSTNSVFIWTERTTKPYKGFDKGRWYHFTNDDTKALRDNIKDIELLAPRLQVQAWEGEGVNQVTYGKNTGAFSILGDYPALNKIDPMNIVQGRFINDIDIAELRKVAVLGSRVADALFDKGRQIIGEYVEIRGVYFKVVGVFKSKHKGGWGEFQEQCVFLPFTTLQKTYNYGDRVGYYSITSKPEVRVSEVEEKVKAFLRKQHSIHPDDDEAIGSFNLEKQFMKFQALFLGISILVWIVGSGTLLAGVIGVSNIMLVIIKERTKEIGIQRALGAKPWNVISQIITESIVLTSIAGFFGLLLGVALLETVNNLLLKSGANTEMFTRPGIDFKVAVTALLILIGAGIIAGFIPARRAVSIKPIDAIRSEQ